MADSSSEVAKAIGDPLTTFVGWVAELVPPGPGRTLLFVVAGLCVAVAPFIYKYYLGVLAQGAAPDGSIERQDYDKLRESLAGDNLAARLYAKWLTAFLDEVDRFFGDAGMADRTLFPRAFGLKKRAPLWTAPAFDRCLLLALIYPIITIFLIWAISGHVGPAEAALGLRPDVSVCLRVPSAALSFGIVALSIKLGSRFPGWKSFLAVYIAAVFTVTVIIIAILYNFTSYIMIYFNPNIDSSGIGVFVWSIFVILISVAIAGLVASGIAISGSGTAAAAGVIIGIPIGILTAAIIILVFIVISGAAPRFNAFMRLVLSDAIPAGSYQHSVARIGDWVFLGLTTWLIAVVGAIAKVTAWVTGKAIEHRRYGLFLLLFYAAMALACLGLAATGPPAPIGPFLLFLGLLTLLNAPFDWASLGLTRALLRRGLELGGWWPPLLALVDAALAGVIVALLALTMVIGVQAFDELAVHGGGKPVLPLDTLFDGIAKHPAEPQYWWVYALLLSSMIPSLINLAIGGMAFTRGIPWLARLLLQWVPEGKALPEYKRQTAAIGLTVQMFAGAGLGIVAQALLAWGLIFHLMPALGLDLLDMARAVAAFDLPARISQLFVSVR